MALGTEWPCPETGDACQRYCPQTACRRDLDAVCDDCGWSRVVWAGWAPTAGKPFPTDPCPTCGGSGTVDEASWPDVEPDPQDLANVEWPMT